MEIVRYGEWEIAVDVEKTKEYYKSYISKKNQANRNFAEYCKVMPSEDKAFSWTYCKTHENDCGPYFYRPKKKNNI